MWVPIPDARIRDEVLARIESDPSGIYLSSGQSGPGCGAVLAVLAAFVCGIVAGVIWFP